MVVPKASRTEQKPSSRALGTGVGLWLKADGMECDEELKASKWSK